MTALNKTTHFLQDVKDSIWQPKDINFWLSRVHPLWSLTESLAQVVDKQPVAKDTVCLTLKCNRHVKLGHAGQHHPVSVLINGRRYERQYSLAAHPTLKGHVQLTVKKMPQGKVSGYLHDQIRIGAIIGLGQPYGEMQTVAQPMLLLAAGSGITPMLSILRAWQKQPQHSISLHYWVKQLEDAAHLAELEQLAEQYPQFNLSLHTTQQAPISPRLTAAQAATFFGDHSLEDQVVYACGPMGFVQQAEQLSASAQRFIGEAFSVPRVETTAEHRIHTVTLTKQNKTVEIASDQPILIGLEQAGIQPTFGCRMGVCNKCSCPKVQGQIKNMLNGDVNAEPTTQIKLCINTAQSDLVLDL